MGTWEEVHLPCGVGGSHFASGVELNLVALGGGSCLLSLAALTNHRIRASLSQRHLDAWEGADSYHTWGERLAFLDDQLPVYYMEEGLLLFMADIDFTTTTGARIGHMADYLGASWEEGVSLGWV